MSLMGSLVDGSGFRFQCFDGCFSSLGSATGWVNDVPVLCTADNGSNGKFGPKPGPDLAPYRELQFGAVEINIPVRHSAFVAAIFSMLASSCNFMIDGFDQLMIVLTRLLSRITGNCICHYV